MITRLAPVQQCDYCYAMAFHTHEIPKEEIKEGIIEIKNPDWQRILCCADHARKIANEILREVSA